MTSQSGARVKTEAMPQTPTSSKPSKITERPAGSMVYNKNAIVVCRNVVQDTLISDEMGWETVPIQIGTGERGKKFAVHKKLICATSAIFMDMFSNAPREGHTFSMPKEDVDTFDLFNNYLYTKRIPDFSPSMTPQYRAYRTRVLCQLYTFAEKYSLKFEIRNKIMDRIQDGFLITGLPIVPELVLAIYKHSRPGSKLRGFALAGLYRWYRSAEAANFDEFKKVLRENDEIFDDFLRFIRNAPADQDPCVRQCHGYEGCTECQELGHERIQGLKGVFPCEFHIHKGQLARLKAGSKGPPNTEIYEQEDTTCHLWSSFPSREFLESHGMNFV